MYLLTILHELFQEKNEKRIKTKNNHHTGKCVPCNSCICCPQFTSTTTFKSNPTNKTFKDIKNPSAIHACKHLNRYDHDVNYHGKFIIIEHLRNITNINIEKMTKKVRKLLDNETCDFSATWSEPGTKLKP